MNIINDFELSEIIPLKDINIKSPLTYIGCAGFEDRATSVLDYFSEGNCTIKNAIGITYYPIDERNKEVLIKKKLEKLNANIKWCIYDRYYPQDFEKKLLTILNWGDINNLVVDISGMSKLLIMILLQNLKQILDSKVIIAYAEAQKYFPTKKEYEKAIIKGASKVPIFLTDNIFNIITSPSLSSVSMQNYPILLIAFPTFNYLELIALYNEMHPQEMMLIEGIPLNKKDKWRLEAIREINKSFLIDPDVNVKSICLSTFDYISNINALNEIYNKYQYTHKILLAPTGSKLQTISSFIFKQLHPDVQIIYPVTKSFIGEYSEKCRELWGIKFDSLFRKET